MSPRPKLKYKIGCDPEFVLALGGKRLTANDTEELCHFTFRDSEHGEIGMDCGMAELRPKPANDIIELAKNIKHILKKASEKVGFMEWDVSSNLSSSGGHIHLELPARMLGGQLDSDEELDVEDSESEIPTVDDYTLKIFSFYLPVWLADDFKKTNSQRAHDGGPGQGGYGHYGDARVEKKSSGRYTYELRTPSAQWLTCPKTMLATFAYLATIHHEIMEHPETFKKCADIVVKSRNEFSVIEDAARQDYKPFINPLLKKIQKAIKKFELYPHYKREINWLFQSQKVRQEKEKYGFDILKGWQMEPKAVSLAQLNNKRSMEAKIKAFPHSYFESRWNQFNPFQFNDDANVAVWSHELAKRMYMLNWKIKRKYIFFGFKKGTIEEAVVADKSLSIHVGSKALNTEEKMGQTKHALLKMIKRFSPGDNTFMVGLPYNVRKANDMKFLTDLIHFLEHELPLDPISLKEEEKQKLMSLKDAKDITPEPKKNPKRTLSSWTDLKPGDIVTCSPGAREHFSGKATYKGDKDHMFILLSVHGLAVNWVFYKTDIKFLKLVQEVTA